MQKKKYFLGANFIFFRKKGDFSDVFCFLRPAFGHGRLGHPQSLEYVQMFSEGCQFVVLKSETRLPELCHNQLDCFCFVLNLVGVEQN